MHSNAEIMAWILPVHSTARSIPPSVILAPDTRKFPVFTQFLGNQKIGSNQEKLGVRERESVCVCVSYDLW